MLSPNVLNRLEESLDEGSDDEIPYIPPMPSSESSSLNSNGRRASTAIRLRRQGMERVRTSGHEFALRSIRLGSQEWMELIKPFVSDLVFRSAVKRRYQSTITFVPYSAHAAVLFVDLSSYSKIAAEIAHRGAHALSTCVNEYLERLLQIAHNYGGDVVKFAGDAVLIVWEGEENDLPMNVKCAAKAAVQMQQEAPCHPVPETDLNFQIHCGLTCGIIESEIFKAPNTENMQRLYHSVGGEALIEITELVDYAKAGQISVSDDCFGYIRDVAEKEEIEDVIGVSLLTDITFDKDMTAEIEAFVETTMFARAERRTAEIEEDFIHPVVLRHLKHGGLNPTHIAQMRDLGVLFIAMTSGGSSVNWLMEVQAVLDRNSCPIVQILDDDKGVHVVAALNLYEASPGAGVRGTEICNELVNREVGCAIGFSRGACFCGVTGSSTIACRWDITGPAAVRAARLMQYALANDVEVAIDESVNDDPMAGARLEVLDENVSIKGTAEPCRVYRLSGAKKYTAFRVLENIHGPSHDECTGAIFKHIGGESSRSRCAVVATGCAYAGKKIVCQKAAGYADLQPFLHVCQENGKLLELARTIATWYSYVPNEEVRQMASIVLELMSDKKLSKAYDFTIQLVSKAVAEGLYCCIMLDRFQFVDDYSLSLMRECLSGRSRFGRPGNSGSDHSLSVRMQSSLSGSLTGDETGKIVFLCAHVPLYNQPSAEELVDSLTRSAKHFEVPLIKIGEAPDSDFTALLQELGDSTPTERWIWNVTKMSGRCIGYTVELTASMRLTMFARWKKGLRGFFEFNDETVLDIPEGTVYAGRVFSIMQITAEVAMRVAQVFDELPPLFQTAAKIVAVGTRRTFYKMPWTILWEAINDFIADGVDGPVMNIIVEELAELFVFKVETIDGEKVISFQNPGIADIALDVCTPVQVKVISKILVDRLEPRLDRDFGVSLVVSDLYNRNRGEGYACSCKGKHEQVLRRGYEMLVESRDAFDDQTFDRWLEEFQIQVDRSEFRAEDIIEKRRKFSTVNEKGMFHAIFLVNSYQAPVSLGPNATTLSLICRYLFRYYRSLLRTDQSEIETKHNHLRNLSERYKKEVKTLEYFLKAKDLGASEETLDEEFSWLEQIVEAASKVDDIQPKAKLLLESFIPTCIHGRIRRIMDFMKKIRDDGLPDFLRNSKERTLVAAYDVLQSKAQCRNDLAQDAIMTMATRCWKPRPYPEGVPKLHVHTVARIRNKCLKKLRAGEISLFQYEHTIDDLEAFLIITPLLYDAQDNGYPNYK